MADLKESRHLKALKDKLREMFQLDQADLDFGIYRIMNQKRDEIERFLDKDLLPQVREALQEYQPAELTDLIAEWAEIEKNPGKFAESYVAEVRQKIEDGIDISKLEEEVYSHLSTFFSRYYQDGDFLSLRRYKEGVYALPYEGEEVKLHWANADQYYIKSTEAFRTYAFKVPQSIPAEPGMTGSIRERRVRFDLVSAGTERDNTKAASGKERRFILDQDVPLEMDGDELVIRFHYRPDDEKRKQKDLNAEAIEALLGLPDGAPDTNSVSEWEFWRGALSEKAPTDANANRTVLEKHLTNYTARNSFDYFIHKDLGGFLRRELDFFIKNEVMFLDDIESDTAPRVEQYLSKIRVLRKIAHKIIAFLAQLENFQKKLWLKKKFVLRTDWLVPVRTITPELLPNVLDNEEQIREWRSLYPDAVEEFERIKDVSLIQHLVVDTAYFGKDFKDILLSSVADIDESTIGTVSSGDNFHFLRLISEMCREDVKCIYIDPPYNTGSDEFLYKDSYQHSSWLSFMEDRLEIAVSLMSEDALASIHLNDIEDWRMRGLISRVAGEDSYLTTVITKCSTVSSFRTVNSGPVDVSDRIIMFARDKMSLSYKTPYIPKREFDHQHFSRYVVNIEDHPSQWKFKSLKLQALEDMGFECSDTREGMRLAKEKLGDGAENLVLRKAEAFAVENAHRVFETKTLQKPSPYLAERIKESRDNGSIVVVDRENAEPIILMGGRQFYFLKKNVVDLDGKPTLAEPASNIWLDIDTNNLSHEGGVEYPNGKKPLKLVRRIVEMSSGSSGRYVLDYFAGSATTAHACIEETSRGEHVQRFLTCDSGGSALSATIRRLKTIVPEALRSGRGAMSSLQPLIKVIHIEGYEDSLDNITLNRSETVKSLLGQNSALRENYTLQYMLGVEAKGSLLSTAEFSNPFVYTLSVVRDDERKSVEVDLIETFNYLLGLRVKTRDRKRGVLEIVGESPEGETVLVLWRNVDEVDNDALDDWFQKQGYNARDLEFQLIYVNGDNNIENQRRPDETWKVRLIEEYFHKLMFDVEGV